MTAAPAASAPGPCGRCRQGRNYFLPERQLHALVGPPSDAERAALRDIIELGEYVRAGRRTFLVVPVTSFIQDVIAAFEADQHDGIGEIEQDGCPAEDFPPPGGDGAAGDPDDAECSLGWAAGEARLTASPEDREQQCDDEGDREEDGDDADLGRAI